MGSVDQRKFPRYFTDTEIIVYQAIGTVTGRIMQISRGGCLVFPPLPSASNPSIKMSFRLADVLPFINCKGEIVYSVRDRGTGIVFREISEYYRDLITEFFEKRLAAEKAAGT